MNSRSWKSDSIQIAMLTLLSGIQPSMAATPTIAFGENLIRDVVVVVEKGSKSVTSAWTKKRPGLVTQKIDLSILAESIDKGNGLKYVFSGCVGTNKDDSLKAIFLTDSETAIGVAVLLADEGGKLAEKSVSGTLPQGTRAILIEARVALDDTTTASPMLTLAPQAPAKASQ